MKTNALIATLLTCGISEVLANDLPGSLDQIPLHQSFKSASPTVNFTTLSLASIGESQFTILTHPSYPSHSIRIKQAPSNWCDPSVKKYTGYIDISPARHLWFYFFESRRDPEKDDVILWTNGGPGGSSTIGLFAELGPCTVVNVTETAFNPYSWNELSNIFFIDQPIGVGYSYADYGEVVSTTEESARDVAVFAAMFFDIFESFKGRPFHLTGESYGGRYLPVFASEIYERNKVLKAEGKTLVNLKSVMIGNGWMSHYHMVPSYYEAVCTTALYEPIVDIATCVRMKTAVPRCKKWMKKSCYDTFDHISCQAALSFCNLELAEPFLVTGKNLYDVSIDCTVSPDNNALCYPQIGIVSEYLKNPSLRKRLGVSDKVSNTTGLTLAWDVNARFWANLDSLRVRNEFYLEGLLERGVDVLIYAGTYDWIANWVGINNMMKVLEWKDSHEFQKQEFRDWYAQPSDKLNGTRAGWVKNAGTLTFLMVEAAGHMVPMDKPAESLAMLNKWLDGESF